MKNVNASVQILTLGEASILDLPKVGFLSSRKVPPAAVMKCYDWATEMRDKGVCVMGGFQSPLERDVLMFLLQGKQPVVWVLAHKLWTERSIPKAYRELIAAGRLLVVSPVAQTVARVDARTATIRNRYILEHSEKVVFAAIDPNGALSRLIGEYPDLQWQVLASVGAAGGFILDHRDGHNRPMSAAF